MEISNGQLTLKKHTLSEWLAISIFVLPFFFSFFMDFIGLPSFVKYSIDVSWALSFVYLFFRKNVLLNRKTLPFLVLVGIWFLYVTVVYLFQYQSIFYYLWGIRNNLRFYVAFFAFVAILDEEMVSSCLKFIDFLFWINVAVTFFQFFVQGYQQDYLGGIFGVERGCNAYSSILFAIVVTKSILLYMNGKEKTLSCLLKCAFALVFSAMAEIKFFFVLFIIILIIASVLTKFSWRKVVVFGIMSMIIMFAGSILTIIFGSNEELSLQRIFELATSSNYATAEDLGRFTAIPIISERILTTWPERLFGMGIGNCDTSAFAICNTPFFQMYESLHYSWFSSAFLFLETGYVGLAMNIGFFVLCFISSLKRYKEDKFSLFAPMGIIFAVICVILTFYNSALRKEVGYLLYFGLALPLVTKQSAKKQHLFS